MRTIEKLELNRTNFWIAQLSGWAIIGFFNLSIQLYSGLSVELVLANSIFATSSGILVTTIYHYLIRSINWQKTTIRQLILFIGFSSLILAIFWMIIASIMFAVYGRHQISLREIPLNLGTSSLLFLIWNLIYFFFKYFSEYQEAEISKWQLDAKVKEAQLGTLKSQINPHFVFNTLNNIIALIAEDKEKGRNMLIHFSDLFRYALQMTKEPFVSIEQEIEMIHQYLELLSIQFEHRLTYKIQVDEVLFHQKIPPMMLQLLVENAIKHGIALQPEGGLLDIALFRKNDVLKIEVRNTGNLHPKKQLGARLGVGLKNIEDRLKLLYRGAAKIDLVERVPFVVASIQIPME